MWVSHKMSSWDATTARSKGNPMEKLENCLGFLLTGGRKHNFLCNGLSPKLCLLCLTFRKFLKYGCGYEFKILGRWIRIGKPQDMRVTIMASQWHRTKNNKGHFRWGWCSFVYGKGVNEFVIAK